MNKKTYNGFNRLQKAMKEDKISRGLRIEIHQHDWIPGFAAFCDDNKLNKTSKAFVVINLGANLLAAEKGDLPKEELPYMIAENIMHEVIHVLEKRFEVEFSEERVELLLDKYREKYGKG